MAARSEEAERARERLLAEVLEQLPVAVFVLGAGEGSSYANRAALELLGDQVLEQTTTHMLAERYHAQILGSRVPYPTERLPLVRGMAGEVIEADDIEIECDGERLPLDVWGGPLRDESGQVTHGIAVFFDATARRDTMAGLVHQALHDPLTGLANRTLLLDRVQHALDRLARHPTMHAVLYFDIDGLKSINDDHGHRLGDEALVAFASGLREAIRPTDTAARLGGDEFVVFCEDVRDAAEAEGVLARIQARLADLTVGDSSVSVVASVGLAIADAGETAVQLLHRADRAMYKAKPPRPR